MKKKLFMVVCLLSAITINARDYQHSVGIMVGNSFGISYKGYVRSSDHFVVETNLQTKMIIPGQFTAFGQAVYIDPKTYQETDRITEKYRGKNMLSVEANPNLYYQGLAAKFAAASMYWYVGGGIGLGALWFTENGYQNLHGFDEQKNVPALKFDEHAVVGLEFCFSNIPLNLSMDFRPGVGEFVHIIDTHVENTYASITGIYFDWTIGISLRYRIGK